MAPYLAHDRANECLFLFLCCAQSISFFIFMLCSKYELFYFVVYAHGEECRLQCDWCVNVGVTYLPARCVTLGRQGEVIPTTV